MYPENNKKTERPRYRSVQNVHKVSGPPADKLFTNYRKLKIMI